MGSLFRKVSRLVIPLNSCRSLCVNSSFRPKVQLVFDNAEIKTFYPRAFNLNGYNNFSYPVRSYANNSTNTGNVDPAKPENNEEKPGIVARFKQMYRDYWYVLVPVHLVTSACWLGGFYYLAKSGVDVIALLKSMGISEKFTDPLKDSSMGYYALAYALYKIATPVRYTVTVGGTTISIKYLLQWGYIKPIPSREQLKEMYQERKEGLQEMYQDTRQELRHRKYQIKERKDNVMSDIAKYKQEMKEIKESELKNK